MSDSDMESLLRESLSPKALAVLATARELQDRGARLTAAVDAVKEEVYSPDGDVWATADGQGFVTALMIDDAALTGRTVEEVEDIISDVLVDASGRGQAAGEALLSEFSDSSDFSVDADRAAPPLR